MRNLGGSAGISIMLAMLMNFSAGTRAQLITPYSPDNAMLQPGTLPAPMSITSPTGINMLSSQVDLQAAMLGYTQVFHLMFLVTLAAMPLVLIMRMPKEKTFAPEEAVVE